MKVMNLLMEIVFSEMTHLREILDAELGKTMSVLNVLSDFTLMRIKNAPKSMIFVGHGATKMAIAYLATEDINWMLGVVCLLMQEETQVRIFCVLHLKRVHVYNALLEPILMIMGSAWKLIHNAKLLTT